MMLSEIREQLAVVAQRNGRPEYEVCVLKAVQFAVMNGTDHPLKAHLKYEAIRRGDKEVFARPQINKSGPKLDKASDKETKEISDWIAGKVGRLAAIARESKTSQSVIWRMRRTGNCTKQMYERLNKARISLEAGVNA